MNTSNKTLLSFALSIGFWWLMLGSVEMAIGFLVLIFIHEMGHFVACKYKNLSVLPPVFTPMGAYVQHSPASSAAEEAFVSYAGPLFGTVAGIITMVLGLVLNVPMLFTLAGYSFLINLLNMIPMRPLDGGGISMAIHRNAWVLGIPMLLYMFLGGGLNSMFNIIILIMIVMGFAQDLQYRKSLPESYFQVGLLTKVGYTAAYLGLGGLLFWLVSQPQAFLHLLVGLGL